MKKIAFDTILLSDPTRSLGIQYCWENWLFYLSFYHDVFILLRPNVNLSWAKNIPIKKYLSIPASASFQELQHVTNKLSCDIFTSSLYTAASVDNTYLCVHDMIGELLSPGNALKTKKLQAIQRSKIIWSVSESSRQDLHQITSFPLSNIFTIHNGANTKIRAQSSSTVLSFLEKFSIKKPYFLIVGSFSRHKNRKRMVEAFQIFNKKHKKSFSLIIVGPQEHYSLLDEKILTLPRSLSDFEISCLYSGAYGLLHASLFEGFGFPITDAQGCFCPVLTSNISCMPEIGGDSCSFVNPYDVNDIVNGIEYLSNNRTELIRKGSENVKRFSWQKSGFLVSTLFEKGYL